MPSVPFLGLLLTIVIALLPAAAIAGLGLWARWLRRRALAPQWAGSIAYGLVVIGALPFVGGAAWGAWTVMGANAGEPGDKARVLAEGISEAMNCGALGLLVGIGGMLWLGFCTWMWHRAARRRLVVGAMSSLVVLAAAVVGCLWLARRALRGDHLREATNMVLRIRVAQEGYHSETQQYANISSALAANQRTNHFALYPQAQRSRADT